MNRLIVTSSILLALLLPATAFPAAKDVVLVVNAANTSELDANTIKRILLARTNRFPDGSEVRVILRSTSFSGWEDCTAKFLEKTPGDVQKIWTSRVFSGASSPPQVLAGDLETLQAVANQRGAISCVSAGSVTGPNTAGVRVIRE